MKLLAPIDDVCPTVSEIDSKVLVSSLRPQDVARMRLVNAVAGETTAVYDFILARIVIAGLLKQVANCTHPRQLLWVSETGPIPVDYKPQTELINP